MRKIGTRIRRLLLCAVIVCALAGSVYAYMFARTQSVTNTLIPAKVSCVVEEVFAENTKSAINVRNTGNIDAYLRVRLVTYWVNDKGEIVAEPSQMPTISVNHGWLKGSGNTYYYSSPIAPGQTPPVDLLSNSITLVTTNEGKYRQVIEVFAEAIQSLPEKAAENSWGVTITDGTITAVP